VRSHDLPVTDVRLLHAMAAADVRSEFVVVLHLPEQLVGHLLKSSVAGCGGKGEGGGHEGEGSATRGAACSTDGGAATSAESSGTLHGFGAASGRASGGKEPLTERLSSAADAFADDGGKLQTEGLLFWSTFKHPPLQGTGEGSPGLPDPRSSTGACNASYGSQIAASLPRSCALPSCGLREDSAPAAVPCLRDHTGVRLLVCHGCRAAHYCCQQHQREHWLLHKPGCGAPAASSPVDMDVAQQPNGPHTLY